MSSSGAALLVSSDFPPVSGGQSRYLFDLWSGFPSDQVVVLAPALPGDATIDAGLSCEVVRTPLPLADGIMSKAGKVALLLRQAGRLCRRRQVSQIHCGQVFSAGFVGWACSRRFPAVRYFPYVHGADLLEFRDRFPWGWILRRILGGAERVIVNSRFTGRAVAACGVPTERILVVNPSIDLSRFDGVHDREATRQRLGWTGSEVILSVGRLVSRKGHDTVIRALPRVAEVVPGVRYAVVGDGPMRAELEALAAAEGVRQRVEFRGFVPEAELPALYAAADLFAMVSRQIPASGDVEGFGIVYLEANAAGLAVLAGRSGGVEDAVVDEETGLLVDPEKPEEVAAALGRLLRDPVLRGRLAEQGRQRVRREFDRCAQARRLWEACR